LREKERKKKKRKTNWLKIHEHKSCFRCCCCCCFFRVWLLIILKNCTKIRGKNTRCKHLIEDIRILKSDCDSFSVFDFLNLTKIDHCYCKNEKWRDHCNDVLILMQTGSCIATIGTVTWANTCLEKSKPKEMSVASHETN